jgi:hypothetical protein
MTGNDDAPSGGQGPGSGGAGGPGFEGSGSNGDSDSENKRVKTDPGTPVVRGQSVSVGWFQPPGHPGGLVVQMRHPQLAQV